MTVDFVTTKLIADRALQILENECGIAAFVNRDYEQPIGKQGKTITIRKPASFVANDFDPSAGITVQDPDEDSIELTVDQWKETSFQIPDFEASTIQGRNLLDEVMTPAEIAISEAIEANVLNNLIYSVTNPLSIIGSSNVTMNGDAIIDAQTRLFEQKVKINDKDKMRAIVGPRSRGALLKDKYFANADFNGGTDNAVKDTDLRDALGFRYSSTQLVPKPVPGDTSGQTTASAGIGTGTATSPIPMSGVTVAPPEGTLLTFASHSARYVVDKGTTTTSLILKGPLTAAVASGEIITFLTGEQNIFFHKNAFTLAMVPLATPMPGAGSMSHVANYNGYSLRVEVFRDGNKKRNIVSIDALWTSKMIQPEMAVKYLAQGA